MRAEHLACRLERCWPPASLSFCVSNMRTARIVVLAALVFGVAFWALFGRQAAYRHFSRMDSGYYRQLADACDSLLQQHPVGTNDWVSPTGHGSPENAIQISGSDPALPKLIRDLNPDKITVHPNRVFIGVPNGGFAIIWGQSDKGTNWWHLRVYAGDEKKTLYETTK